MSEAAIATTSGLHGEIRPGWTQNVEASPHVVGDTSGGIRETTFSANASAASDLMLDRNFDVDGVLDSVGNVLNVALQGDSVGSTVYDLDALFLPVREFPPVASGYEEGALDLVMRLYGEGSVALPWTGRGIAHAYYPLRGYSQGFTVDGNNAPYYQDSWARSVTQDGSQTASYFWGKNAVSPYSFVRLPEGVYSTQARPLNSPIHVGSGVNFTHFRARMPAQNMGIQFTFGWEPGGLATLFTARVNRGAGTAGTIDVAGNYRQNGSSSLTNVPLTSSATTGLDMSEEISFVVMWGFTTDAIVGATFRIYCYAWETANPPAGAPTVSKTVDCTNALRGQFVSNNSFIQRHTVGQGGFRDVITSQKSDFAHHYPVIPEPSRISHNFTKDQLNVAAAADLYSQKNPIHGWTGSGWDYLKMLCAARGRVMAIENGVLVVRDIATSVFPLTLTQDVPKRELQAGGRARSVDVTARTSVVCKSFNAATNYRRSLNHTVRENEESTITVSLPRGEHNVGSVRVRLVDSDGITVTQAAMIVRGFRFAPAIDRFGNLTITVRGPSDSFGLGVGPWTITELEVTSQGFFETSSVRTIYTGAAESMVTRDKGSTVDNPFLTTISEAFDRGIWAAADAGEPTDVLTFNVARAQRGDYYPGRLILYGYTTYRVMKVSHGKATSTVRAVRYVTVGQHDAKWAGATVGTVDAYFTAQASALGIGTFRCLDGSVRPLQSSLGVDPRPFVRAYPSESQRGA